MAKLSMFLPPFAGDYSGAAGVLFGLNSVNVIVDASCCTHNYTGYDEPRWKSRRRATFSAQLRTLEATLGDDSRLLDQTERAVQDLGAPCVALIGTPVPALVGMDLDGMASELEFRCGVPVFGLSTTGFDTYELGASAAQELLADRFAAGLAEGHVGGAVEGIKGAAGADCFPADTIGDPSKTVNILGVTVHDFGSEAAMQAAEQAILEDCGTSSCAWSAAGEYSLADIAAAGSADKTVVATWSGLAAARLLEQRFGVPVQVGLPEAALRALPGVTAFLDDVKSRLADAPSHLLIVHDQVIANSLRDVLRGALCAAGAQVDIRVASFFSIDSDLAEPGDFHIETESDLITFAAENPNVAIAGDPLLRRLPNVGSALVWELPHEAVSCTLYL